MAKLEYTADDKYNQEANKITFEFEYGIDIHQFKVICIRMASAMGYVDGSIKSAFGAEYEDKFDEEMNDLIKSVFSGSNENMY
jgi:hypothetical protein